VTTSAGVDGRFELGEPVVRMAGGVARRVVIAGRGSTLRKSVSRGHSRFL
jgi:hypothetical protein